MRIDRRRDKRNSKEPLALPGDCLDLGHYSVTGLEAENAILGFLRDQPGVLFDEWKVINRLCSHYDRKQNRRERQFYLRQLMRLVRERKVIRYRKGHSRGQIRISQAYV